MFHTKRFHVYLSLLVLLVLVPVGSAIGQDQSSSEFSPRGEYHFATEKPGSNETRSLTQTWLASTDLSTGGSDQPFHLAQAEKEEDKEKKPLSPECAAFARDPQADLGEVL